MTHGKSDLYDIEGSVVRTTEKAILFKPDAQEDPVWLPKSQIEWDQEQDIVTVPGWLLKEKGLENCV